MAISAQYLQIVRALFEHGMLPQNGALLEVGEANWYDTSNVDLLVSDVKTLVDVPARRDALLARLETILENRDIAHMFEAAKVFYELYFAPSDLQAIDLNGTKIAKPLDLNKAVTLDRRFDVVFNHGTAEHIFNIGQVFRTVHEYTLPGGLMIHESPFTGWIEHGFYSLQPTLFFDLAAYNRYQVICMIIEDLQNGTILPIHTRDEIHQYAKDKKLPENSMMLTVLRKDAADSEFVIPMQGVYRGALSTEGQDAWYDLR